ncbi:LysR family transcriptional regulator [Octadecabacter antarcticus 307]|uniref:LysR family transcriptional regulator n=1 Tax=Octadecabacter antarcticus 307 TaxID=391626 RepID=M9R7T0_9RHOB|nr:LysR family transcriptional regulator [Octadecabacter antarcticus]AGI66371.1 LysR family transcriptional regulator [Octadecabacter antarcticus 307]
MDNWDEIRTAFQVARIGTVSGAADVLGVHHATVIRHIDGLEKRLGVKLFQRHARGYTATEAGQDLMQVAAATEDQFTQLAGRIRGHGDGVSGDLVVTSLVVLSPMLTPILANFRRENPDITVRFLTDERLFRLEYGEAHVAIRAGEVPNQPDNVVQPFMRQKMHLAAAPSYVADHGTPDGIDDLPNHWFIGHDNKENLAPFNRWLTRQVPESRIVFRTTDYIAMFDAVLVGAGIGFVTTWEMQQYPDLIDVIPSQDDWSAPLWLVTHVDLHRTTKVQTFLAFLKKESESWAF